MKSKPYLIFSLHGLPYAIDAVLVKEIFLLPELMPIEEAPEDIVGILNLRSQVVPIMHLDLRFGHPFQPCQIDDSVIVLESQGLQIGIIVNQVQEVQQLDSNVIETDLAYGRERDINSAFVSGVAKVDEQMIVLLNVDNLLRYPEAVKAIIADANEEISSDELAETPKPIISSFYDFCCPQATPQERKIFRQRAENLTTAAQSFEYTNQNAVAILGLNGEYFGLDLQTIKEFTNVRNFTPIPCCPEPIIANMNWRGEIVTLIDLRVALGLSTSPVKLNTKVVIVQVDDIVAGFPVEEIYDVMYLTTSNIQALPIAAEDNHYEYFQGIATYQGKMLSILNLEKILTTEIFIIDQAA